MITKKAYYLDTNILLDNFENLLILSDSGENVIVLSRTMLSEMDSKKTVEGAVGYNAREFFRLMEKTEVEEKSDMDNNAKRIILKYSEAPLEVEIHLVSLTHFDANESNTDPKNLNDQRIIETAKKIKSDYADFHILSNDIAFRSNAILDDLDCESFKTDNKKVSELNLYRSYSVDESVVFPLTLDELRKLDSEEVTNVCGVELAYSNGNKSYGYREGACFYAVSDEDLRKQIISPINIRQKILSSMALSDTNDVVVSTGMAGCSMEGSTIEIEPIPEYVTKKEILSFLNIDSNRLRSCVKFGAIAKHKDMYDKNSVNYALMKLNEESLAIFLNDSNFDNKYLKIEYWLGFNTLEYSLNKVRVLRKYCKYFDKQIPKELLIEGYTQKTTMMVQSKMISEDFEDIAEILGSIK